MGMVSLGLAFLHHLAELIKVNLAVSIVVDLIDVFSQLFPCQSNILHGILSKHIHYFMNIDFPTFIFVKHIEGGTQIIRLHIYLCIKSCSNELSIVDLARVVSIGGLEQLHESISIFHFAKSYLELIKTKGSVSILIELDKHLSKILDVIGAHLTSNSCQRHLLNLLIFLVAFEIL